MVKASLPALSLFLEQPCADGSWSCTAGHLLQWLYALAVVLAIVLVLVTALAIHLWRKNKDTGETR